MALVKVVSARAETRKARSRWHTGTPVLFSAAFCAALLIVRALQAGAGAGHSAFGSYPDEPSHFISGVMIHDYLLHGIGVNPFTWASDYYLRVPFFAVGYWPPFFYIVEALWMFLFGIGWTQALWLSAAVAALTAATIFIQARKSAGPVIAACAGLAYLLWPPVQWSDCAVMTDTTVALMGLWALIALGRYLETERPAMAILFGICASMTILTKYSGLFLVLIPLPALIALRRWPLLRRWSFWSMPAIVALLWGPWLMISARYAGHGLIRETPGGALSRTGDYLAALALRSGPPLGLLLLMGWVAAAVMWRHLNGREIVWLIAAPAILLFLVAAPIPIESRYLVPLLPPLILLLCSAMGQLAAVLRARGFGKALPFAAAASVVLTATYAKASALEFSKPRNDDIHPVAAFTLNAPQLRNTSILAPADDEGRFIADTVTLDRARGQRILIRPNKLMAEIDWNSYNYKSFYNTPESVEALFEANPIDLIVIHAPLRPTARMHERLLSEMVEQYPDRWRLVGQFPATRGEYRVYQFFEPAKWGVVTPLLFDRMKRMEDLPAANHAGETTR